MKELNGIKYIERKPTIETDHPQLFLLIHGYGSNEEDLFSLNENEEWELIEDTVEEIEV